MGGGQLILLTKGEQDLYLTKKPDINFFQSIYYQYENFSSDVYKLNLNSIPEFGNKSYVKIPKYGHLLSKIYLHLKVPPLVKKDGTYACWVDSLGYAIFESPIELQINGIVVERLFPTCLDIRNELNLTNKRLGFNEMILKSDMYRDNLHNATDTVDLMIPLDFYFTKQYSMSFPLFAIQTDDIQINFNFREFNKLINYDGILPPDNVSMLEANIYTEYIFLEDSVLEQFTKEKHTYIIEQMVYNGDEVIPANKTIFNTTLNFANPCKELLFTCIDISNINNNNYFNYSRRSDSKNIIKEINLTLDNKLRFNDFFPEFIYRQFFPNNLHSRIPDKYVYCLPFSLTPDDSEQPSGSINLGKFDEVTLNLRLMHGNPECQLHVYSMAYNVLTIENGEIIFQWMN